MNPSRNASVAAALLFLALTCAHTWPISRSPAHITFDHHDVQHQEWTLSWIQHALRTNPLHLFDGNIFAPERNTLAYSEPLLIPAIAGAPVRAVGGSPVLVFNLLLIAGLTLTAWVGWFVISKWTGSFIAGLVGGALVAFNVHLLTRLAHVAAIQSWGLPIVLFLVDRIVSTPNGARPRTAQVVALAATIAAIAATSAYLLALAATIVAVGTICSRWRWRLVVAIAIASIGGLALASPILLPYVRLAATGAGRPLEVVAQFSATPAGYLVSTSRLESSLSRAWFTNDVNVFFAGFVALALAVIGLGSLIRGDHVARRRALLLVALAGVGVVFSFGASTFVYRALYHWLPPLHGLRAVARFGYLYLMAVAVGAGFGVAWIERRVAIAKPILAAVLLMAISVEVWQPPLHVLPFKRIPAIYGEVARLPPPTMLVEAPFYPAEALFENSEYDLNATAHWKPLMNGYSSYTPMSYRRRAASFWFFPADWAIQAMKTEGVTHVMVHLQKFGAEAPDVIKALDARSDLRLLATDRDGRRLYAFR